MANPMQNDADSRPLLRADVYRDFVRWFALPYPDKKEMGIVDQLEFAKKFDVSKDTLSRWKQRPEFEPQVNKIQSEWGFEKTSHVLNAIYQSAIKGNAKSQRLWLQYTKGWNVNKGNKKYVEVPVFGPGDISFMINMLPEPLRTKYNIFLRDLLIDTRAAQEGRIKDLSCNAPDSL